MTTYRDALKPGSLDFVDQLAGQMDDQVRSLFEMTLTNLARWQPQETVDKLKKLQALENHGVGNWQYYDDAMEEAFPEEENEDEDAGESDEVAGSGEEAEED